MLHSLMGDDPKKKKKNQIVNGYPRGQVFQTQEELDMANAFAKDFSQRNSPYNLVKSDGVFVGKNIGDPIAPFVTPDEKPYMQPPAKYVSSVVPPDVVFEDIKGENGQFYYETKNGETVPVGPYVFQVNKHLRKNKNL